MKVKNLLKSIFLVFVLVTLFSGCSSNEDVQEQTNDMPAVVEDGVNSPEAPVQDEVTTVVEDELISDDDDVSIGDLI